MKCHDEHERRRAAAPAAAEVKALQTPPCAMTFGSLSDQDHIMVIILQPAGSALSIPPGHPLVSTSHLPYTGDRIPSIFGT